MKTPLIVAVSALLAACTPTAQERFGDVARYAPTYGGYVVGADDDALLLRDPVTSEKIRCRDDLERAAPALTALLDDETRDRHARKVAPIALGPFTLAADGAALLGIGLWYPAAQFGEGISAPQPRRIYEKARDAFLARRFAEARGQFMIFVISRGRGDAAMDNLPPVFFEHSLYYLALSDEALGLDAEARQAFRRFLTTAMHENEGRYRDAEERLLRLEGERAARCGSRADFKLTARGSQ